MAPWRVVREHPPCFRLQPEGKYRGAGMFAFGGAMVALFLLEVLGWFGVLAMARDLWAMLGTLVTLAIGPLALYAGARARWGWCELEIADVAITMVDGMGWRIRRTARIDRPAAGVPLTVVVEHDGGGDTPATHWLSVHNGEPYGQPIQVARGLDLSRATLEQLAVVFQRWDRGEPPITYQDAMGSASS